MIEKRSFAAPFEYTGNRLVGYAAVFDSPTPITEGGRSFTEVIRQGAFDRAIRSGGDIIATFNHDPNRLLGRTSAGTLKLSTDGKGLRFEIDLPEHASDVREMVQRGDLKGASFTFTPRANGEKWNGNNRELTDLYLYELGPVAMPAYRETSVGLRSRLEYMKRVLELKKKM